MSELDADILERMTRYCGRDPRTPRMVHGEALYEIDGAEWSLDEFQELIADAIATIPPESRDSARVSLDGGCDVCTSLKITYHRMQTPEEVSEAVQQAERHARWEQARERAQYDELRRKYGASDITTEAGDAK